MAEVPNLLDMFQNNRKDARAIKPAAEAKAHGAANLLPVDPTAARTAGAKAGKSANSFQAKVEKSKAKLAAKGHKFFAQNKAAAKSESPAAKPVAKDATTPPDRVEAAQAPVRKDRPEPQSQSAARPEHAQTDNTAKPDTLPAKGMDQESLYAIKEGLADLGIEATEAQLNDPAYLMDMLRLLQSLPSAAALAGEAEGSQSVEAIGAETAGDAAQIALPLADEDEIAVAEEAPAAEDAKPPKAEDKLSRSELADLIGGRAAGLNQAAAAAQVQVTAQAPTTTPKEWQGIQVRPQAEGPGTQPLPMADLDRLRVMQASAMQAEGRAENTGADLSIETDTLEPSAIDGIEGSAANGDAEGGQEAQADLSGQNGDRAGTAEPSALKDGPMVAKDAATGPQFNQSLDQARSVDHRAGIQRGEDPRAARPEASVLEQIARKLAAGSVKSGDTVSIQLSPEHLGKVRVSLEMTNGAMAASIAVENDAVKKQVEANLPALREALQNQGIQLQGLEVSVDQRHANLFNPDGSNSQSFFGRNGRGGEQGGDGRGDDAAPFESAPEADTGRRWGYNTMEYIG